MIVAHRGFAHVAPENSLQAVVGAEQLGAEAIEVDVRVSRDRVPLLMHDKTLQRTTSGTGVVSKLNYSYIARCDAGDRQPPPTLRKALDSTDLPFLLDIKPNDSAAIDAILSCVGSDASRCWFQSANTDVLLRLPVNRKMLLVSEDGVPLVSLTNLSFGNEDGANRELVSLNVHYYDYSVAQHRHALQSHLDSAESKINAMMGAWTINRRSDALAAIEQGYTAIVTDRPSIFENVDNL